MAITPGRNRRNDGYNLGTSEKIDAFLNGIDKKLILEVVRSGVSGIARGESALRV